MRFVKIILCTLIISVSSLAQRVSAQTPPPTRIVIAASTVLDGKGRVLRNTRIVIEGSKIVALEPIINSKAGPVDYDLRGLTVLPGWIDAHVHINWFFGKNGKLAGGDAPADEAAYAAAANAWMTRSVRSRESSWTNGAMRMPDRAAKADPSIQEKDVTSSELVPASSVRFMSSTTARVRSPRWVR